MRRLTGFHAIEELLRSAASRQGGGAAPGWRILVAGSGPRVKSILDLAAKLGHAVSRLGPAELDRLAPGNRGIALELPDDGPAPEADLESYVASAGGSGLVLVLDHIEDPQNFGAIVRSADVFAADLVVVPKRRSAPRSELAMRASAGALAHVPVTEVPNLAQALRRLAEAGFWRYAADMGGRDLAEVDLPSKCVFVLGNEGAGLSRLVAEECDEKVSIPQRGHVDSLNVSASAAVLMYEYRRRRGGD
jgi:23S rRNA (guanosine2251-2'-O)-methyltransferase